jgi:serine/threonine-protein kinase RsbT
MTAPIAIEQVYHVEAGDYVSAGDVSGKLKKLLKQLGVDSTVTRRAAIAGYEAELNLVIHSLGGEMSFSVSPEEICIITQDTGPGIPDIGLAMTEGFSTASEKARELGFGAGMGLPNIKRCADEFEIDSKVGQGTRLKIIIRI